MFYFVVRHLRWLARVPLMPQFFDAMLLAWTALAKRSRLAAMEMLEVQALKRFCAELKTHRFGGSEFFQNGRALGHVHGNGLLDVHLRREEAAALIANGRVRRHHVLPNSGWVSFQMESPEDVPFALSLLEMAAKENSESR